MPTPILDLEILKLRRRLGDIYSNTPTDSLEIVTANPPGAGQIWVGDPAIDATFRRDELTDIYNDAVRLFIDYITRTINKENWYNFIPGYIFEVEGIALSSGSVDFESLDPPAFALLDVKKNGDETPSAVGIYFSPNDYFDIRTGVSKTRKPGAGVLLFTVMSQGTQASNTRKILVLPTSTPKIDIVYVRSHSQLVHGGSVDISGILPHGLQRVQIFAEMIARRYRAQGVQDLPEKELQTNLALDRGQ